MSVVAAAPTERAARTPGTEGPELLAGTGRLVRLFLRLDRLRISLWALGFLLLVAGSVVSLEATYTTPESLQTRAALLDNPSAIMMTGPAFALDHYTFGAMLANELSLWVFVPAAVMSVLLVIRHTRGEEESGRLETLRALPVGRFAPPTAALVVVGVANLTISLAVAVALVATGSEVTSSLAFATATGLTGVVFGAVAAVTAQLTEHSRAATGMALAVVAVAFLVRGLGDVVDHQGSWLSWFSPFAWAQQTRLYVDLRWWPLLVPTASTLGLLALAVTLARRRDLGAGLRAPRRGRPEAAASLLSPAGLARRLTSGTFVAWTVGLFLFAIAFGSLATALEDMLADMPAMQDWIEIDVSDLTRSFSAVMLSFLAVGPAALLVSAVLQLRGEEQAGRVEGMVATGSSRSGLLAGWLAVTIALTVTALVAMGLGLGLGVWAATGDAAWVGELTAASTAYLPATLLLGAVAVALYGWVPQRSGLAWLPVGWATLVVYLGDVLDLPDWARNLSPLAHTPLVPGADLAPLTLVVLTVLAGVLAALGFMGLQRRDIPSV